MLLTDDLFTINVRIKKKIKPPNQKHQLLWKANASERNGRAQSCAAVHGVAPRAAPFKGGPASPLKPSLHCEPGHSAGLQQCSLILS